MRVALTGGTGFLGGTLLRLMHTDGHSVRAMIRRRCDAARIRALGAATVRGDLIRANGCDGLVQPGDVVIHAAARVELGGPWLDFKRTTVAGTRALLDAALAQGPRRFVYVSSAGVYSADPVPGGRCADRTPANPAAYNNYGRAKLAAERLVQSECERAGVEWTILRLGVLYGERNRVFVRRIESRLRRDRLFIIGDGSNCLAILHVEDAARAVLLAAEHPTAAGRIYDVGGNEPVTQRQYFDAMADALGFARTRRSVRADRAFIAARFAEMGSSLLRCDPPFSRTLVAVLGADQSLDTTAIRDELGWEPRISFERGMVRFRDWYARAGRRRAAATRDGLRRVDSSRDEQTTEYSADRR